jgi:hypothetical protein
MASKQTSQSRADGLAVRPSRQGWTAAVVLPASIANVP